MGKGKRKGTRVKHSNSHQDIEDKAIELSQVSEGEIVSPIIFHDNASSSLCTMTMLGQSESSNYGVAVDVKISQCPSNGVDFASSTGITCDADKEHVFDGISDIGSCDGRGCDSVSSSTLFEDDMKNSANLTNLNAGPSTQRCLIDASFDHNKKECNEILLEYECLEGLSASCYDTGNENNSNNKSTEQQCASDSVACTVCSKLLEHNGTNRCKCNDDLGDWMVYWDSFYERNYFYNIKTHASTWYPPPGMEHLAYGDVNNEPNELIAVETEMDVTFGEEVTDVCNLQTKTHSFEESMNNDKLGAQIPDELSVGIGLGADNSLSGVAVTTASRSFEHTDALYEITSCNNESILSFLPNTPEHIDRYSVFHLCVYACLPVNFCIYAFMLLF
jgi:trimethylguanosine synthase